MIELLDGTKFDGSISHYMNEIWIRMTVPCAAEQMLNLIDPSKTQTITEHYKLRDILYHGFTKFGQVRITEDKYALFYLTGQEDSSIEEKWNVPEEYLPEEWRKADDIQNGSEQDLGSGTGNIDVAEHSESASVDSGE